MKKLKHSKIKNTGILFELLVRQITIEVLNGDKTEHAKRILKEFFNPKTELNRELRLYDLLIKEKYNTESKAEKFIDTVCEAYKKINQTKLSKEKYNLIKEISSKFDINQFFSSPITNYKEFASVYKLFESKKMNNYNIKDAFNARVTIIENIISRPIQKQANSKIKDKLVETYKSQDKDLRLLTYRILVENFNKKYTTLNREQKALLKEYINNINNTTKFKEFVSTQIPFIVKELKKIRTKIDDKITLIKLDETVSLIETQKIGKRVSDKLVSTVMLSYELIKELKDKTNEK